jgi:signal transduction histidine kinase
VVRWVIATQGLCQELMGTSCVRFEPHYLWIMRPAAVRPVIVAAMLALTAVLAAVLTAEGVSAARDHRVSAERVLHDYAALGAEGIAQRLKGALNGRFSTVLLAAAADHGAAPPTVTALRATITGTARELLDDSIRIVRVTATDPLAPLLREATTALPSYAYYFDLAWMPGAHGMDLLVFQPFRETTTQAMAFTLSRKAASALIAGIVAKDPVLPASLTHGASLDSAIGLRVTSAHGELVNRRFDSSSTFRAALPLGQPFADLAVEVSLSESLAPALIIGGLPRSRVPLLVALLALTIALTIASGDQLRRELELSRLRDDFVSSVSHELRTPLAQIRLFAETLRLGRVRSLEEGDRSLRIVENEAKRLEHLVENLLHFSRAGRRALQINTDPTNLTSLLLEIVAEFAPLAAHSESKMMLDLEPDVRADVDDAAIRQVMLNLLDNAVKYGRHGQVITVRLSVDAGVVRVEVEDQGDGIAPEDRKRIWKRFWRSESARRGGVSGTGVGLAIVSDLARLHGGTATAENSPDGGARIVISLPRRDA